MWEKAYIKHARMKSSNGTLDLLSQKIGHKGSKEANQNMFIDKNSTMSSAEDQSH